MTDSSIFDAWVEFADIVTESEEELQKLEKLKQVYYRGANDATWLIHKILNSDMSIEDKKAEVKKINVDICNYLDSFVYNVGDL